MKEEEIVESNKLIAEFMGIELFSNNTFTEALLICSALDLPVNPCTHFNNTQETVYLNEFKFNKSWDWLLPVISKIEELGYLVTMVGFNCYIDGDNFAFRSKTYNKLQSAFETIIEFITWYNLNK